MKKQQTKEEAFKSNLITLIVLEAIGVICLVLGFIIQDLLIFAMLFALTFILVAPYVWVQGKKRINRSYCPSCSTKYDYQKDISWEVTDTTETATKETANVEFECLCRNCKEKQEFTQKFVVATYDQKNNSWKENNIETLTRKYFWK